MFWVNIIQKIYFMLAKIYFHLFWSKMKFNWFSRKSCRENIWTNYYHKFNNPLFFAYGFNIFLLSRYHNKHLKSVDISTNSRPYMCLGWMETLETEVLYLNLHLDLGTWRFRRRGAWESDDMEIWTWAPTVIKTQKQKPIEQTWDLRGTQTFEGRSSHIRSVIVNDD